MISANAAKTSKSVTPNNSFQLLDGSDEASLIALKASAELDTAAEFLTNADEEDMLLAEQRIEDALEAILDAEIAGNEDSVSNYFCFLK